MSAAMTGAYMRARWPGVFADAPALPALDPLAEAITAAQDQLSSQNLGRNYAEAVVLLAGHFAILTSGARAAGQNKVKAGQVEVEYGVGSLAGDGSTGFYALFLQLVRRRSELRIPLIGG